MRFVHFREQMGSANLRGYALIAAVLFIACSGWAQYPLHIQSADKDSLFIHKELGLTTSFKNKDACTEYIFTIPALLQNKGYLTASVDSVVAEATGTTIRLYVGESYRWTRIDVGGVDPALLSAVAWSDRTFSHHLVDFRQYQARQQQLLDYLEDNGYPFAKVSLDSVTLAAHGEVSAKLKVEKGPLYHIDSIRLYGTGRISNDFMQRYLNIPNG
jgi:outer membrane protein assembly factor BamA